MSKRLTLLLATLLMAFSFHAVAHDDHAGHAHAEAPASTPGAAEVGKNYFLVEPAQPTNGETIEVVEVFSYACIHCAHFQPYADQLKAALPSYAKFTYVPAIFNAQWEAFARAYYTAQSLNVLDTTHQKLFDAIHRDRRAFRSFDDIAAFYGENGVDVEKFKQASTSMVVEGQLARSKDIVPKLGVDGTPTLIVNGKYRITGASAGGYPQLIELVQKLVKQEHDAAAKPAAKGKK